MVRFENVSFHYPNHTGLKNVNISIEKGQFVFFVAPTAHYKSTLLNLIYGLVQPLEGNIYVLDYVLPKDRKRISKLRRHIGFIFQNFLFFDQLTVRENLLIPLLIKEREKREDFEKIVDDCLFRYKFLKADTKVKKLSSGEKQLLNVLRAIITKPQLILADEPLRHLPKEEVDLILSILDDEHKKGVTIIATASSPHIPESFNKEYYLIKAGKIVEHEVKK